MLLLNIIAVLFIYSIYIAWLFNLFFFKSFTQYVDRDVARLRKEIYDIGRDFERNVCKQQQQQQQQHIPKMNDAYNPDDLVY